MKILYFHQYFKKPEEGGPLRSWYLATALAQARHEVHLCTGYNGSKRKTEQVDGIDVHYLPVNYDNSFGFFRRSYAFLKYVCLAIAVSRKFNADICIATSTPLTVGLIALILNKKNKLPFVFEVRDLWPQAPIEFGVVRNPLLKKMLRSLERTLYSRASKIIALSEPIRSEIARTTDPAKISVLPNMSDTEFFSSLSGQENYREKYGISGQVVITYAGAVGPANDLSQILNVAKMCKAAGNNKICFVIAGKGAQLESLMASVKDEKLNNVRFTGFLNQKEVRELLSVSDFGYVSFASKEVLKSCSPNKFFDYLASGTPVISNLEGWWVPEILEWNCGFYYSPDEPDKLMAFLAACAENPVRLLEMKVNARLLAEAKFSRKKITEEFVREIEGLSV